MELEKRFCKLILLKRGKTTVLLFLKVINNSSILSKGNHNRDGVWIFDIRIDFHNFLSPFSPKF